MFLASYENEIIPELTAWESTALQAYAEKYAADKEAFFKNYPEAHAKLSSLGTKFDPAETDLCGCPARILIGWLAFRVSQNPWSNKQTSKGLDPLPLSDLVSLSPYGMRHFPLSSFIKLLDLVIEVVRAKII